MRGVQRQFQPILFVLASVALVLCGCTNEFLTSYKGERFAATRSPETVTSKPANSGLIGSSNFVSGGGFGSPEALDAARAVGADSVQWSRGLDARDRAAGAGVVQASLSPTGPVSSWAPVQPGGFLYRYVARYYKVGVADSPQADASVVLPRGGDAQIIEDAQAATQKASGR